MTQKLISQGAEAKIFLDKDKNIIIKDRTIKSYRHPKLDEKIRKSRTKSEAKLLEKSSKIINVPKVIKTNKFDIEIEYIPGERLSETLNQKEEKEQFKIMNQIGKQIAKLHDSDIIHGDLTTSNTILIKEYTSSVKKAEQFIKKDLHITKNASENGSDTRSEVRAEQVYIIDFGLGFISKRLEDKAVDLHLIKQALEAKHYQNHEALFKNFLKSYNPKDKDKILEQLKKVESRGRYKH